MGLRIDLHTHTRRYSSCSRTDPEAVVPAAVKAGLDGLVITEHFRQWTQDELAALLQSADAPGFLLLSGFEYTSTCGDILIYGLSDENAAQLERDLPPAEVLAYVRRHGGACIAAHPTREGMGFDERILTLPFAAIEVCSTRLQPHERALAMKISEATKVPPVACSDAHAVEEIGRFATTFTVPVRNISDLRDALLRGRFHI
ncbi:MAG TPA: PHP-associated domain-containing protein [Candidatus Hydrogenedentes bacterium]|mgnify:CR=1 FL=1|nr:PHP-associated domain-containing protein [Candidatus Hydrogenedentota bacterium]HOL77644.1 PHP-associated domain-containing protein [Candidatus Hydrogenedentota bacterium]HPO87374.1 PHP-associated domain-containing protein [Candidatus Hydrogenedentota bacterium]